MKFRIHDSDTDDSIVIEGETLEELRVIAQRESSKRNWEDPWSEEVVETNNHTHHLSH